MRQIKGLTFEFQTTEESIRTNWKYVISTNAKKSENANHRNKLLLLISSSRLMPLEEDIKVASTFFLSKKKKNCMKN
jgi:hypothetical protein